MKFKPVQILFFVDGVAPSPEDIVEAGSLNAQVMFRNARAVPAEGCLEACDGVAGKVPPRYAEAYPTAAKAIKKRVDALKSLADKVGDSPAPAAPEPPAAPKADAKASDAGAATGGAGEAAVDASKPAPDGKPAGVAWKSQ